DGEDPDSFSKGRSLEEVQRYIEDNAKDFLDFKSDILLGEAAGNPLKKANFVNDIADTIARIPDAVKRSVYVNAAAEKFDVAPDIIFTRVKVTRERLLEDERRERERARAADKYENAPVVEEAPAEVVNTGKYVPEVRKLAAIEEEILSFVLQHGCEELHFETDSPFYDPENTDTVADFISSTIESTGEPLTNSGYRRTFAAYMELYDQGLSQDEIVRTLLDSPDRLVAGIAGDFSTNKYQLSVKRLESSMTNEQSWLVSYVPRAMLTLAERRAANRIEELRRSLRELSVEEQLPVMKEMTKLQRLQRQLKERLKKED
nr:hypothetical protein [Bacteroidales bacterium]